MELRSPVLVFGARSAIARAIADSYAAKGCSLILAARDAATLEADKADLAIRHRVEVETVTFDVTDGNPDGFFARLGKVPGTVVMVVGLLGDQNESAQDDVAAARVLATNFEGPARYLLAAARAMEPTGGTVVGISSVAGDRGRGSNYVYGSAKAGFTAFLSGMRNALTKRGVHVLTVKPGFVRTAMTDGMDLPARLTAEPGEVGRAVVRAHAAGRDVVYVRPIWRIIMGVICAIPERFFKRLSL